MSGITHPAIAGVDDPAYAVSKTEYGKAHDVADGTLAAAKVAFTATDKLLGRATAGAGNGEEIALTAAGRALLDDATAADQLTTLGAMAAGAAAGGDLAGTYPNPTVDQVSGPLALVGIISPAQLTSNQDDWNPTGLATATVIRLSGDVVRLINGLAGGASGREILLINIGANRVDLVPEAGTSTAANRFSFPTGTSASYYQIEPKSGVRLWYDGTDSRWRVIGYPTSLFAASKFLLETGANGIIGHSGNTYLGFFGTYWTAARMVFGPTAQAINGVVNQDGTLWDVGWYDSQRRRNLDSVGWAPSAFPLGFMQSGTYTTSLALAAVSGGNGGSVAVPILVPSHMLVQSISFYNGTGTGSCEARLFREYLNNGNAGENTLAEVAGVNFASRSNTASAVQTVDITTPGTYLAPGLYWLVFRNTHASTVFALGSLAAGTMALANAQTKPIAALGSTLDLVAATWTKINSVVGCRLNGRVFGGGAAF